MSHFVVFVIGEDIESQLAPYHEFECTGRNDEYVQDIDITEEVRGEIEKMGLEEALEYNGLDGRRVLSEDEVNRDGDHKFGYAVVKKNGDGWELIKAVKRTNPNARWDWYSLGGRWTGFFKLKPGLVGVQGTPGLMTEGAEEGTADQARIKDIDFESVKAKARERAQKMLDKWREIVKKHGEPEGWESVKERIGTDKIGECREFYNNQPAIKAAKKSRNLPWMDCPVDLFKAGDDFPDQYARHSVVPFAFIHEGKWCEKGKMGWWAIVTDEQDEDEWTEQWERLLESLPDDTMISVVDCHI